MRYVLPRQIWVFCFLRLCSPPAGPPQGAGMLQLPLLLRAKLCERSNCQRRVSGTVNGQQVAQRRELRPYTGWGGMVRNVVDQSNICP